MILLARLLVLLAALLAAELVQISKCIGQPPGGGWAGGSRAADESTADSPRGAIRGTRAIVARGARVLLLLLERTAARHCLRWRLARLSQRRGRAKLATRAQVPKCTTLH